jgi:sec-independent protein translocase protein TatA
MGIDNPVHLLFIAVVALVVLGPKRLPELTRALGHGIREFREAINTEATTPHAQESPVVAQEPVNQAPAQDVRDGGPPPTA